MSICYLNGAFLPTEDAKISVYDRSYLFGEGLFESFRSYEGHIPFLADHLQRMEWSSTVIGLDYPSELDFKKICDDLLKQNNIKDARFKMVLSRQSDTMGPAKKIEELPNQQTNITVYCEPFDAAKLPSTYKLKTIKTFTNDALPISAMKSTNYLVKTLARQEALEFGFDDGVLINSNGQVTETTSANIFWIDSENNLYTVVDEQGLIGGNTKKQLKQLAKDHKITIKDSLVTPKELSHAKEIFVTNAVIGIMPVVSIDDRQISGGEIGSITAMLRDLWNKFIQLSGAPS